MEPDAAWIAGSAVEVYSWGACGGVGGVGGDAAPADVGIRKVTGLEGRRVVQAAIGAAHVALLTDDGEVFSYGSGSSGQLGLGPQVTAADAPTRVTHALDSVSIVHVACGARHTAAVTSSASLITWGDGEFGQLGQQRAAPAAGDAAAGAAGEPCSTAPPGVPDAVSALPRLARAPGVLAARAAGGEAHTLLLTGSGHVYSCGHGTLGALGVVDEDDAERPKGGGGGGGARRATRDRHCLTHIDRLWSLGIVKVACGDYHSVCLSCEGHCYAWGRGNHGQLGLGARPADAELPEAAADAGGGRRPASTSVGVPTLVRAMATSVVADVSCGSEHTLILTNTYVPPPHRAHERPGAAAGCASASARAQRL